MTGPNAFTYDDLDRLKDASERLTSNKQQQRKDRAVRRDCWLSKPRASIGFTPSEG